MTDDAPPVLKLSEKCGQYPGALPRARKRTEDYSGFSEYFAAEIEPRLRQEQYASQANVGYAAIKRRYR